MFFNKLHKFRPEKKVVNGIRSRWKFVAGILIGSGTGLFILMLWSSGSIDQKVSCDEPSDIPSLAINLHERMANMVSISEGRSAAYCISKDCKTVTCSSISSPLDPGQYATAFFNKTFQAQCPHTNTLELLEFRTCTFPNNKLQGGWLTTYLPIEKLSFHDCLLEDFTKGSFASSIFANLQVLTVAANSVRTLKKHSFDELKNLKRITFENNKIHDVEANLLYSTADSLEILELDSCINDVAVLANITSHGILSKLTILSAQRNYLSTINGELFKSIPNIVSLYLGQSRITSIESDTLTYTRSLGLLDLTNNLLTKLATDTLTPVLSGRPDFKLSLAGNPWDCSCELEWIKDLIRSHPDIVTEIPKCETPAKNARLFFTAANFCVDSQSDPDNIQSATTTTFVKTTRNNGTDQSDEPGKSYVKFTCSDYDAFAATTRSTRKLLSTEEWKFPSRFRDFYVSALENGDVMVNLKKTDYPKVSLIWFKNMEAETSSLDESSEKIDCVRDVSDSLVLKNLTRDSSYTICLLENMDESPSPLNCLATRTRANATLMNNDNVWLTSNDKSVVIPIGITLLVIVSLLSALSSYWLIRRYPSLLRGSKRIVMVKKRGIDALVMPKGTSWNSTSREEWTRRIIDDNKKWSNERCLRKSHEADYLNPMENCKSSIDRKTPSPPIVARRKDSKVSKVSSLYSGGSYISGIEATPSELYNYRNTMKMKSYYSACMEDDEVDVTPPTPPPHRSIDPPIPSVSLALQSNNCPDISHRNYRNGENL